MAYQPSEAGTCPHCLTAVRFEEVTLSSLGSSWGRLADFELVTPEGHAVSLLACGCPHCGRPILFMDGTINPSRVVTPASYLVYPDASARALPTELVAEAPQLAQDYREAEAVLPKSRKASAALSRRCLQHLLISKASVKSRDLVDQIDEVIPRLPSELAHNVDAIRHIGNFAAHPLKSKSTGEIVDVEDGEAEWLLDVLYDLFDHFFVAPARAAAKRDALNAKLKTMGKPPLKGP